jgi:hypothetical protein
VLVLASLVAGSAAQGSVGVPSLKRLAPAPRLPQGTRAIGVVPASTPISGAVVLKPRDSAALQQFIGAVSDKSSPRFGQYLPPGAFAARFGPTAATIAAVRSQLQSDGLKVTGVSSDGVMVHFSGSAATAQSAFHVGLKRYRLSDGTTGRELTSAAELPSNIAPQVAGVVGLQTLVRPHSEAIHGAASARGEFPKAKAAASFPHPAGSPTPCGAARNAALTSGGLTDDQIVNSYGGFGLYGAGDFGAGQRVAVFELEPFLVSDLKTFDTCYFGANRANAMISQVKVVPVDGGQPSGAGSGEAVLDVEDVSAVAPGAGLDVYEAPNTSFGALDQYAAIINADQDRVITTSWGFCEQAEQDNDPGDQQAENVLFEQAAAQGQTVFSAAGDTGDDDCNAFRTATPPPDQPFISTDDPSSQPYVVGAGGTTIDNATQPPQERVWNDGNLQGGGGGGISQSWTMPSWQRTARVPGIVLPGSADYKNAAGVLKANGFPSTFCAVVPGATTSTPCRLVPDVAAQSDEFTGAITVFSESFTPFAPNGWTTIGGTSSAAPLWAGMLADINASATCAAQSATANGVGFVSPLLYAVASIPSQYAASFNDVTVGNNDIYGLDNGLVFPATKGYDLTTGLGSPRLTGPGDTPGLAFYLCSAGSQANRPVVSNLSPRQGSTSGGETVTITGTGFGSASSPAVSGVQVGVAQVAAGGFQVTSPTTMTVTMPTGLSAQPPQPGSRPPQNGAGPVNVLVTRKNGVTSVPGASSTFEYVNTSSGGAAIPSVNAVSPTGGLQTAPGEITILGSGFNGTTKVTFGGVNAPNFTVVSPFRIIVHAPPYSSSSTACVPLPTTGVFKGENAANDICQVYVRVSNKSGTSATGKILPPPEGAISFQSNGAFAVPPGCSCEIGPAPTEFDYVPKPAVTSISTSGGPASLASENGDGVITVRGRGLGLQTIDWGTLGPPDQAASQDTNFLFLTGTQMQIVPLPQNTTTDVLALPFGVKTLGGSSAPVTALFAGIPDVTGVVNKDNSKTLNGTSGAVNTGGTPIQINGDGFSGQVLAPIEFNDAQLPFSVGTQNTFTVNSDTRITTQTVSQNPAFVDVQVCTVTGCSDTSPADQLILYPPGDPNVDTVTPTTGPAVGGTKTTIRGENLGCVLNVFFGNGQATHVSNLATFTDCGSTVQVAATSPAGTAGKSVPVTAVTAESYFTGSGRSTSSAKFTYAGG